MLQPAQQSSEALKQEQSIETNLSDRGLPEIGGIRAKAETSTSFDSMSQNHSALLQSKKRHLEQFETSKVQRRELLSVLAAQKRTTLQGEVSPWDAYHPTRQDSQLYQSIPNRGISSQQELHVSSSKIPRKVLQRELTNERSYGKINTKKGQKVTNKMQGSVKLQLADDVEEIIPRLANFPMQKKTKTIKLSNENYSAQSKNNKKFSAAFAEASRIQQYQAKRTEKKNVQQNYKAFQNTRKSVDAAVGRSTQATPLQSNDTSKNSSPRPQDKFTLAEKLCGTQIKTEARPPTEESDMKAKYTEPKIKTSLITVANAAKLTGKQQLSHRQASKESPAKSWVELERVQMNINVLTGTRNDAQTKRLATKHSSTKKAASGAETQVLMTPERSGGDKLREQPFTLGVDEKKPHEIISIGVRMKTQQNSKEKIRSRSNNPPLETSPRQQQQFAKGQSIVTDKAAQSNPDVDQNNSYDIHPKEIKESPRNKEAQTINKGNDGNVIEYFLVKPETLNARKITSPAKASHAQQKLNLTQAQKSPYTHPHKQRLLGAQKISHVYKTRSMLLQSAQTPSNASNVKRVLSNRDLDQVLNQKVLPKQQQRDTRSNSEDNQNKNELKQLLEPQIHYGDPKTQVIITNQDNGEEKIIEPESSMDLQKQAETRLFELSKSGITVKSEACAVETSELHNVPIVLPEIYSYKVSVPVYDKSEENFQRPSARTFASPWGDGNQNQHSAEPPQTQPGDIMQSRDEYALQDQLNLHIRDKSLSVQSEDERENLISSSRGQVLFTASERKLIFEDSSANQITHEALQQTRIAQQQMQKQHVNQVDNALKSAVASEEVMEDDEEPEKLANLLVISLSKVNERSSQLVKPPPPQDELKTTTANGPSATPNPVMTREMQQESTNGIWQQAIRIRSWDKNEKPNQEDHNLKIKEKKLVDQGINTIHTNTTTQRAHKEGNGEVVPKHPGRSLMKEKRETPTAVNQPARSAEPQIMIESDQALKEQGNHQLEPDVEPNSHQYQGISIKCALRQVRDLRQEREERHRPWQMSNPGLGICRDPRFKYTQIVEREKHQVPGPGSYHAIRPSDQSKSTPTRPTPTAARKSKNTRTTLADSSVQNCLLNQSRNHPAAISQNKSTGSQQSASHPVEDAPDIQKLRAAIANKPSVSFSSKVPRDFQKAKIGNSGSHQYRDQSRGTISAQQQELALKTVQKMFASRTEQHTVNAHKLVRINRLQQINNANGSGHLLLPSLDTEEANPASNPHIEQLVIDESPREERRLTGTVAESIVDDSSSINFQHYSNEELLNTSNNGLVLQLDPNSLQIADCSLISPEDLVQANMKVETPGTKAVRSLQIGVAATGQRFSDTQSSQLMKGAMFAVSDQNESDQASGVH